MSQKSRFLVYILCLFFPFEHNFASSFVTFSQSCERPGDMVVLAAMGDILLHRPLQVKGEQQGYATLWQHALPYLNSANIVYANLEGPIAENMAAGGREIENDSNTLNPQIYSGFPLFNYHPNLAKALKTSGFTLVSTANNHSLDRGARGLDKTLNLLNVVGIKSVGARPSDSNKERITIIQSKKLKIAFIACAEHTNGIADSFHQVLLCYKKEDKTWIIHTIQSLKKSVDAIIILPHWGEQYSFSPNSRQIAFAHQVLDAGAIAVLGAHPHVLQPLQKYITQDGRETLIMYSLGNFVSFQGSIKNRTTIILFIGLNKTTNGTNLAGVGYVPFYMNNRESLAKITLMPFKGQPREAEIIINQLLPAGNKLSYPVGQGPNCQLID